MPPISVPTSSALSPSHRILSTNPAVFRILNKLSRSSLLSLVLDWLDDRNQVLSAPHLAPGGDGDDTGDLYPPAASLDGLREYYMDLQARKGGKREVVDRIIEGDWRHGLSLYQLAMADMQHLYDHPTSQKWTALKVIKLKSGDDEQESHPDDSDLPCIPRFHPPTFLQNLQREVLPDVKAHYNLDRHKTLPMLLLRICILESPYNTSLAVSGSGNDLLNPSKIIYIAFPDASPHVLVSLTTSTTRVLSSNTNVNTASDTRSLRKVLLDGIPKAFSRPRERYALKSTNLSAKGLESLLSRRGKGRTNAAGGGWGMYASDKKSDTPLNTQLPTPPAEESNEQRDGQIGSSSILSRGMKRKYGDHEDKAVAQHRKRIAQSRFGDSAMHDDGKGIERLDIRIEDPFPAIATASSDKDPRATLTSEGLKKREHGGKKTITEGLERQRGDRDGGQDTAAEPDDWAPDIVIRFHGSHVFAGLRQLVKLGVVNGERMPGWMTGEEGVSVGVVKEGRIMGYNGSGI